MATKLTGISIIGINRKPLNEISKNLNLEKAIKNLREGEIINGGEWTSVIKGEYIAIVKFLNSIRKRERRPRRNMELGIIDFYCFFSIYLNGLLKKKLFILLKKFHIILSLK